MSKRLEQHIELGSTHDFSLKQKVGQLFMIAVFINDSEENIQQTENLIQEHHIGALCFFHSRASAATNFEGKKKVVYNENSYERLVSLIKRYQKASSIPLLIAMDAEWGLAMRIENTHQYPYALTLGALQNGEDLIHDVGYKIGLDCLEAGIHWNLAPVLDINSNPENPVIGYRSFGDDKEQVTKKAKAFIAGMREAGVLNSLKHFPGHGDTNTDSHLALPVIDKSAENLLENECYPFTVLMHEEADSIMIGHLSIPALDSSGKPATLSKIILSDVLRKKMGYQGLLISDAMNMHAVSKRFEEKGALELAAFHAGLDMFCFSEHPKEAIEKIVLQGEGQRIESSFERVWELKEKAFNQPSNIVKTGIAPNELNKEIARACLTELFKGTKNKMPGSSQGLQHIILGKPTTNIFPEYLEQKLKIKTSSVGDMTSEEIQDLIHFQKTTVISVFPPSVKPKNRFGFAEEELEILNETLKKGNCILYLFGNPFLIHTLPLNKQNSYIILYQDFLEFQEAARSHFEGKLLPQGKLPFQLKTDINEK
ncbi:glycoside hydrolase family 3 protein [Flagellimonas meridianipacifica]|uniref:beta-N-acetylhexosaminidase n=1 Tax=Flagellimonas meridianipacifica TaxID=1080225 RepID=A0A2T0M9S3_9FLAO|nr:glycoside hydrolase family 3 protein [Allomuricauda pacifica]PRX54229.1 beta-glucosidase-like glycosyl hydrolase [Allomuricauda pacifica]